MPTFDTPEPISVTLELVACDVEIIASDRVDTVVEVRPRDASKDIDRKEAERTTVDFVGGKLRVKTSKRGTYFSRTGVMAVTIELPTGSHVQGTTSMGDFIADGRLGDCVFTTSAGDIRLGETGSLKAKTTHGALTVTKVDGDADLTGSGELQIGEVTGDGLIRNINGSCWIGDIAGDLKLSSANGDLATERPRGSVIAKTAYGTVRVERAVRGTMVLETQSGNVEIGIADGTAAWLDVRTWYGSVQSALDNSEAPSQTEEAVEVRARTWYGDIVVRRA
ncbi:DUF4097 family beta strand repeat-containing protein [Amycolatopsis sp. CA-230715]|uniref:DUF4097 family beta strand repeat-containing protein n=1 Tax=Amycolatopsis sp. CA-230715 TaxID=2745196 RepID=UPI001C030703|nr:DUF4097 family beta strand repeat-containing protein [Amycolatopsis sp. CA-230715]QWF78120.1 hypothetical protein HUW46_01515 [Amycolatopsis sp. CA-230715]